jgi:hypothetical protein
MMGIEGGLNTHDGYRRGFKHKCKVKEGVLIHMQGIGEGLNAHAGYRRRVKCTCRV